MNKLKWEDIKEKVTLVTQYLSQHNAKYLFPDTLSTLVSQYSEHEISLRCTYYENYEDKDFEIPNELYDKIHQAILEHIDTELHKVFLEFLEYIDEQVEFFYDVNTYDAHQKYKKAKSELETLQKEWEKLCTP